MWGVIIALQSSGSVHLGVDNLVVVRHVGRLLDGHHGSVPFELVKDGDLPFLFRGMLRLRGLDTVQITNVKGHADEGIVLDGRVGEIDRLRNDAADEAADFGRRRVGNAVLGARRNLSGVCGRWYPVLLDFHRFVIAISRAVVNHDGRDGTAPDPLVCSAGAHPKRRRLVHAVRDRAFLPGPPGIWCSEWYQVPAAIVSDEDIDLWPYTPGLLVKWVESASELFLDELLVLFRYPPRSGRAFLAGTLPLRYRAARFACRTPTWRLPGSGHVVDLVTDDVQEAVDCVGQEVHWVKWFWSWKEKNSTKQKNSSTPCGVYGSISSTCLEEVVSCGIFQCVYS